MNHPTNEVEELYELAQEAVACDDYEQAVAFLRKALELAPLRKDIRRALASALSKGTLSPLSDTGSFSTVTPRVAGSAPAVKATPPAPALAPTESPVSKSLWLRPPVVTSPAPPRSFPISTHGSLGLALQEDDEEDLDLPALDEVHTEPAHLENASANPLGSDAELSARKPRKGTAKRVAGSKDFEDVLADGIEVLARLFSKKNRPRLLHGSAYTAICLFVGTACFQANEKFGGQLDAKATKQPALSASEPPATPRLMLGSTGMADVTTQSPRLPEKSETDLLADARAKFERRQYDETIALLQPTFNTGVRTPGREEIRNLLAQAHNAKATEKLKAGDLPKAIAVYREAVTVQPNSHTYRLHLANALYWQGEAAGKTGRPYLLEAVQVSSAIISEDSSNINAHQVYARSQRLVGKTTESTRSWQKVLSLAPKNSKAAKEAQAEIAKLSKPS